MRPARTKGVDRRCAGPPQRWTVELCFNDNALARRHVHLIDGQTLTVVLQLPPSTMLYGSDGQSDGQRLGKHSLDRGNMGATLRSVLSLSPHDSCIDAAQ